MTHQNFETQLDAYLDGELAAVDVRELETHLAECPDCARLHQGRVALRAAIHAHLPVFPAPDALRERVREALRATPREHFARRVVGPAIWRSLALAASFAVVALGSWRLAQRRAGAETLAQEVLASHVRSLMPGHLTDVLSSDQHTVKPWFNGKLDFSPPVFDFAGRGYPLIGGRLDYVGGRSVAALVYGRRQHLINVLLWPTGRGPTFAPATETRQGYHLLHWTTPDYTYWVVSDLGLAELQDFAQLLRQADSAASGPAAARGLR